MRRSVASNYSHPTNNKTPSRPVAQAGFLLSTSGSELVDGLFLVATVVGGQARIHV